MSDESTDGAGEAGTTATAERSLQIRKIYLKDASFESPAAPGIFSGDGKQAPKVDLQLNTETQRLDNGLHEVVLAATVTGAEGERTAFLVEVKQAGLFHIEGFPEDERNHLLGAYCPGILFPFAREIVADLVQKGGLPQLVLQPINFDALYAQHLRKQQESVSAPDATQ